MSANGRLSVWIVAFLLFVGPTGLADEGDKVGQLIARLGERDWRDAVEVLAEMGEPAVEPLIHTLNDRSIKTWAVQARAVNALAKIGTEPALAAIIDSLKDTESNEYVRGTAAVALGETGSAEMVGPLALGLKDEKQFVRWKCTQALGMLGNRECLGALYVALRDEDQYVRAAAAQALGQMKLSEAGDGLIRAFGDEHWLVRLNARNAMLEIGKPSTQRLVEALSDKDPRVRWQAAWVLGRIKADGAVAPLIRAMGDSNWMVRDEAAVALVRVDSEKAVSLLTAASQQGAGRVRQQATWALSEIKGSRTAEEDERKNTPAGETMPDRISYEGKTYPCHPQTLDSRPDIPSPYTTSDGAEIVIALMKDGTYSLVLVTVENGKPLNYKESKWGKGRQLEVDAWDFPALARTGLHSDAELNRTKMITGRSVVEITELGRPERSSGAGFMASDEDIISVLKGDNRLVEELGLTHPQMARPLFHVWNMILRDYELGRLARFWNSIGHVSYNGRKVLVKGEGSRGWQESVFDDEILGMYQFEMWRELSPEEKAFLRVKYPHLTDEQMAELVKTLSHIHTGEMVPYYIMRYGFYEGHTGYRADPIAIAFVFGMRSLEQIEAAFEGRLHEALTQHFVR